MPHWEGIEVEKEIIRQPAIAEMLNCENVTWT
jgi:hypothetical protein